MALVSDDAYFKLVVYLCLSDGQYTLSKRGLL